MNKDKSESNSKHAVMLSNYSFILILKNFLSIMRSDHILFMPKTHLARFPGIKKKNAILNFLKLFVRNTSISEISSDEVIGHFWLSNLESARALSKIKMELKAQHSFAVLNNILNDEEVINYFQASLAYDLAYQYLFAFVLAAHAVAKVPLVKSVPQAIPKKIEIEFALSLSNAPVVSAG